MANLYTSNSADSGVPVLFIFSGVPGSGKSTLAQALSRHLNTCYLRIDTIEQALRDLTQVQVTSEGYLTAYRLATDNLRLGNSVIADSCNPIDMTRDEWHQVAVSTDTNYLNIEVICSNKDEHRTRVENRLPPIPGLVLPTWEDVLSREYEPWNDADCLKFDTAGESPEASIARLVNTIDKILARSAGS